MHTERRSCGEAVDGDAPSVSSDYICSAWGSFRRQRGAPSGAALGPFGQLRGGQSGVCAGDIPSLRELVVRWGCARGGGPEAIKAAVWALSRRPRRGAFQRWGSGRLRLTAWETGKPGGGAGLRSPLGIREARRRRWGRPGGRDAGGSGSPGGGAVRSPARGDGRRRCCFVVGTRSCGQVRHDGMLVFF
jgi:hypothetical protein